MRLGIVTGLSAEARLARRLARGSGGRVYAGGGTRSGAQEAVEWLRAHKADALLSFGLAGGLDPELPAGTLVIPEFVIAGGLTLRCDPALVAALGGPTVWAVFDAWEVVADVEDKHRIRELTGAAALDMESGAAALMGKRWDMPFAVLRAICDPAERALPPAALEALTEGGRIGPLRIARSLLRQPMQIPALIRLGRDAAAARETLKRQVRKVGRLR